MNCSNGKPDSWGRWQQEKATQWTRQRLRLALKERMPATVGYLCQMLGFLSCYGSFIPHFASKAKPLYNLLAPPKPEQHDLEPQPEKQKKPRKAKKGHLPSHTLIHRTREPQEVLNQLNKAPTKPPILGYPNFDQPFVLHCDASQDGWMRHCTNSNSRR